MYVEYGNGVYTDYSYDALSFRLTRLLTRNGGANVLQDLYFTYDVVGNITLKHDAAIPKKFYNNTLITGDNEYTYDALYRLVQATGRESIAGASFGATDNYSDSPFLFTHTPGDNMAMQNYTQGYQYDAVGNLLQLQHSTANTLADYTRDYTYNSGNNQLQKTSVVGVLRRF